MKGQLARSTLRTSAMLSLRILTQAATLVLLTRLLGPEAYGNFAATSSLAVLLGTIPPLGAGYIMLSRGTIDASATRDVWSYSWPMTLLIGAALLAPYVIVGSALTHTTAMPVLALLLIGGSELLLMPYVQLSSFALQSHERVPLSQFLLWLPFFFRMLAALPCSAVPPADRLLTYAELQFAASTVAAAMCLQIMHRHLALNWHPRRPSKMELREGASYAAMHLIAMNPAEMDKVLAIRAVGAHEAGIYSSTSRILGAAILPAIGLLLATQPRLFRNARIHTRETGRLIALIALLTLGWGLACAMLLALGAKALPYVFGPAYAGTAALMPWMAAVAPLLALRLAGGTILVAYGHPIERIVFELCGIAVLVAGIIVLSPRWGTPGLVMATIAAEATMAIMGWILVIRRLSLYRRSSTLN